MKICMKPVQWMLLAAMFGAGVAVAHHSGAMFDRKSEVSLMGTVKEFKFTNPHVSIVLTVPGERGQSTDWFIEAASVRGLVATGWRRSTLQPGDMITLVGHPLRDGRPGADLVRVTLADGTVLNAASSNY
ncbi:MAG: DUF6152 family protein [Steroidobacteraceae bacterium]